MVFENIPTGYELRFLVDIGMALGAGIAIGAERELNDKPAGISTHCLVIGAAAILTFLSSLVDPNSSSRIAAQIVTGIGFLGAGLKERIRQEGNESNYHSSHLVRCNTRHGNWL